MTLRLELIMSPSKMIPVVESYVPHQRVPETAHSWLTCIEILISSPEFIETLTLVAIASKTWGSVLSLLITIDSVSTLDMASKPPIDSVTENWVSDPRGPPTGTFETEHALLVVSREAKRRTVIFPSNLKGSTAGGARASTIVGKVKELVFENEVLPGGNPVTVVQFRSNIWFYSSPLRNNM